MHDDDVVGLRGKDGTFKLYAITYIRGGGGGVAKVQRTLILRHFLVTQRQLQAAKWQEAHTVGAFDEVLVDERCRIAFLALEYKASHVGQYSQRLRGIVVVRLPAPEGFLVQLDFLYVGAAIDHGT